MGAKIAAYTASGKVWLRPDRFGRIMVRELNIRRDFNIFENQDDNPTISLSHGWIGVGRRKARRALSTEGDPARKRDEEARMRWGKSTPQNAIGLV